MLQAVSFKISIKYSLSEEDEEVKETFYELLCVNIKKRSLFRKLLSKSKRKSRTRSGKKSKERMKEEEVVVVV